ncbi:hypothetical protein OS493_026356 [Desmophyllum pertusum]|uniref:Death domain-containing protein n=1 Tax=Desmophyllum pertusum TaxID=174260 RepID=A0A9X0CY71_9CNID|nr:hypothetical protein OS493_026356 [Desmophyllum pertusum]
MFIKGWISREGGSATVQALLKAVNRSERKDCSSNLEKSLGCQLDCVDNVTVKMESLTFVGPREVKFFGDLDDSQASLIASKLGQNGEALLRRELGNDSLSTKELMRQPQRDRDKVIKAFREALPRYKGVSGPLLLPDTFIRDFGYTYRRNLTKHLCADDSWKFLGEKLGMDNATIKYLDARRIENPADEVLRFWEVKAFSTVGALYDILVELECPYIADLL